MRGQEKRDSSRYPGSRTLLRSRTYVAAGLVGCLLPLAVYAQSVMDENGMYEFTSDTVIDPAEVNQNFDLLAEHKNSYESAMAVDENGNVGIGTRTPEDTLHIRNDGDGAGLIIEAEGAAGLSFRPNNADSAQWSVQSRYSNKNLRFAASSSVGNVMELEHETGNVGIGTTTPEDTLHIRNDGDGAGLIIEAEGAAGLSFRPGNADSAQWSVQSRYSNKNLHFSASSSVGNVMELEHETGNVGIGTTTPAARLEVKQSAEGNDQGLIIRSSDGSSTGRLWMDGSTFHIQKGSGEDMAIYEDGDVGITALQGSGVAYVCVDGDGVLFRSSSPCN